MSVGKRECPGSATEALKKSQAGDYSKSDSNPPAKDLAAIRRRRDAALRCEPLESGHRDPLIDWCHPSAPEPSSFGMSRAQLIAEANRLRSREGWQAWEIAERFARPEQVSA